ncbi:MAG: collagen-like protein, partial [Pseudomonadota bacterium]
GLSGATGTAGLAGASGATGATGARGATGFAGATGLTGDDGATGATGATGVAGATGTAGATGLRGSTGATGVGSTGATGAAGATGVGSTGATGVAGATGTAGASGATGATGLGATGATGVAGSPGGATGLSGATGATGAAGTPGGATGATGVAGATGAAGATGVAGTNGTNGATGATGVGATGATGTQGATGTAGNNGATGATGAVGPVGATGLGATGVAGATGATGARGATGFSGASGLAGATGASGVAGAAGSNGATGATGLTGATGAGSTLASTVQLDYVQGVVGVSANAAREDHRHAEFPEPSGTWLVYCVDYDGLVLTGNADKILCGFVKVGNTGGYSPTGSLTVRSFTLGLFGGGSAGLPAESGGFSTISGLRIRFDSATATVALQNKTGMIWQNASGSMILNADLPVAPSTSDRFYIEKPGLYFGDMTHAMGSNGGVSIAGVASSNTAFATFSPGTGNASCTYSGINFDTASTQFLPSIDGFDSLTDGATYLDETGSAVLVGFGIRTLGSKRYIGGRRLFSFDNFTSKHCLFSNLGSVLAGRGCFWAQGFNVEAVVGNPGGQLDGSTIFLNNTFGRAISAITSSRTRITAMQGAPFAGVNLTGSGGANIQGLDISNQTVPCIKVRSTGSNYAFDDLVSSDNGNTSSVLDTGLAIGCVFTWGVNQGNTIASTGTDIQTFTGPMPFSALTSPDGLNFDDNNLNQYFGTGEAVIKGTEDVLNRSGLDLASFLVIRSTGFIDGATPAQADTLAHAKGILGVSIAISPADDEQRWCNYGLVPGLFEGTTPVLGDTVYLSAALAGYVTVDKPALAFELGTFKRTGTG